MIKISENSSYDEITKKEDNIFYVISKIKKFKYDYEKTPIIGKIKENDDVFFQSFCVADNPLILSEFITTATVEDDDVSLYYFIDLKSVNYLLNKLEQIKSTELIKKYKDLSSNYNLIEKKDLWVYFYKEDINKYRVFQAKNKREIINYIIKKSREYRPCVFSSLENLRKIKYHMDNIIEGKEKRFNKIESV